MGLRRSCLSVPGSSSKMLSKAPALAADEVFIDLEDAVAPGEKTDSTRELAASALLEGEWRAGILAIRVNGVTTPWCARDLDYLVSRAGKRIDCVIVPKVEDPSHVQFVADVLTRLEGAQRLERRIGIEALIENARGLVEVERIAASSERLEALIFGPGDYAASLGVPQLSVGEIELEYPGDQWHYPLSRIVVAARAFGLQAIDGPYATVRDLEGFRTSARRSALLGFDGKWVIHPDQIGAANDVYTPSRDQFDRAERLLASYGRAAAGAAMHEGQMIDEASRKMAEAIIQRGRAPGVTGSER